MVAPAKYHRQGPAGPHLQVDMSHAKERKGPAVDGGASAGGNAGGLNEPLGGFIFVCNNDTMREDLERQLFGLPQRYQDSVRAIQTGLPLFLYNYSTRSMHGVFEATSDGGFNIEPEAWELKEAKRNGRPVSRYPAQVRVRLRDARPPLDESTFHSKVTYYDGPKFRLELTVPEDVNLVTRTKTYLTLMNIKQGTGFLPEPLAIYVSLSASDGLDISVPAQADELLKLFGTSSTPKTEKSADDPGGEWERVKVKSKGIGTRVHRPQVTKRSNSPNSLAGRRRLGPPVNGSSGNSNASQSSGYYSSNGDFGRGREARADTAQRWRSDPDCWSGSSSAGLSTSSWASHDEDRPKKGTKENGVTYGEANGVVRAGEYLDPHSATSMKGYELTNGLCENGSERGSRADSDDLNTECNGTRSSVGGDSQLGSQSPSYTGFTSYSAALKAGMTTDVGSGDSVDTGGSGQAGGIRVGSSVNAGVPSSANADFVGDGSKLGSGKHTEAVGSRRSSANSEASGSGAQPVSGSQNGGDLVWLEKKVAKASIGWDGEAKKAESRPAWSDTKSSLAAATAVPEGGKRAPVAEGGGVGGRAADDGRSLRKSPPGDGSSNGKKSPTGGPAGRDNEPACDPSSGGQRRPAARDGADGASVGTENVGKKIPWQGNDAVLGRLLEPTSGSSGGIPVQQTATQVDVSTSVPEAGGSTGTETGTGARQGAGQSSTAVGDVPQGGGQSGEGAGAALGGSQSKGGELGPAAMATRPGSDVRRDQQFQGPKERDEKVHSRRTQSPAAAESPAVMQQRQSGQPLVPARISPPPLQASRQQFHPDVGHPEMAYRVIPRGLREGEYGVQSGVVQGGWSVASSVPVMSPGFLFDASGMFALPPREFLANAEELHSEILEFAHTASPSAEARSCAEAAIDCVRDAVKRLWPSADVEVFGSYATGLCLSHSDVDVVVVDAPPPLETPETAALTGTRLLAPSIRLLGGALRGYEWCKSISTIDSATMPVIKLHCRPSVRCVDAGAPVVKIDITIGGRKMGGERAGSVGETGEGLDSSRQVSSNYEVASRFHNGAAAREYVIKRLRELPALAPLVLLLKSYLHSKGLKDVYAGGLGSFSLTIMLVFYLERVPIACGTPQEARAQSGPASNASGNSTSSGDGTHSASVLPGTESLGLGEEESCGRGTPTDTVSMSDGAAVRTSTGEGASGTGTNGGGHVSAAVDAPKGGGCNQWTGGIVEQLLGSMHSVASPNLGTLLIGFLHVFGWAIDFSQVRLVTKGVGGSGGLFYHDKAQGPVALTIDDPLRPGANIGAGSFKMHLVRGALQEMFCILTRNMAVASAERVGMGPGRRRALRLLDQLFTNGSS